MHIEILTPPIIEPPGPPRTPGLHESAVIRLIAVENGALDKKWVDSLDLVDESDDGWWSTLDRAAQIRMAIGLAWEDWYIRTQLPHVVHQPGELHLEGVFMTPDGESVETVFSETDGEYLTLALHEVKTTSKSLNTLADIRGQYLWLAQMQCYLKAMGATLGYLHVLFLYGDYTRPFRQEIRVYRIQFTQAEIDDNWETVQGYIRHKRQQQAEDALRDSED